MCNLAYLNKNFFLTELFKHTFLQNVLYLIYIFIYRKKLVMLHSTLIGTHCIPIYILKVVYNYLYIIYKEKASIQNHPYSTIWI